MTTAEKVRSLMDNSGLSQAKFAESVGIHPVSFCNYLKDDSFSPKMVQRIADKLHIPYTDLLPDDSKSTIAPSVIGYLEYKGEIVKIKDLKGLKKFVEKVEANMALMNVKQVKLPKQIPLTLDDIDLSKKEEYDASKVEIKSFRHNYDIVDDMAYPLGNMCGGFPFVLNGVSFNNSEAAYIAGMFSDNTTAHIRVQKLLTENNDGYAAKKEIRKKNEVIARSKEDWEQFNVEWMKYVVWQKCKGNAEFAALLRKIPDETMIVENSTGMTGHTADFWGCFNPELEAIRDAKEELYKRKNPKAKKEELTIERNKWHNFGMWRGTNEMGKILKMCSLCLKQGIEIPIDYALLNSKHIFLLGNELRFEEQKAKEVKREKAATKKTANKTNMDISKKTNANEQPTLSGERVYGIIGAVIGDIVGSRLEFTKGFPKYTFKLFGANNKFTDDSILTIAIADALLHDKPFADSLWEWARKYPYAGWGARFRKWIKGSKDVQLNSIGNGSGMRISPVGFFADTLEETLEIAKEATIPTHNSQDGIKGAQAIASAIFLARQKKSKAEIKEYIEKTFGYNLDLTKDDIVALVNSFGKGEGELARNSVHIAIIAFLNGNDYESVLRTAITYGGDSDTIGCMAGGIAAAYYGVPIELVKEAIRFLDEDLLSTINEFDKTSFQSKHITPPDTTEWNKDCIVVYGSSVVEGVNGEDGSYEVHNVRKPRKGYPIRTIGVEFTETQKDVKELISYVEEHPDKTFLVKKVGLSEKSKIGAEKMSPLFEPLRDKANVYLPSEFRE